MSNLSQKDKHSPVIHTDLPTLDQTKPEPDAPSVPTKHAPPEEIKHDREHKKTGTR